MKTCILLLKKITQFITLIILHLHLIDGSYEKCILSTNYWCYSISLFGLCNMQKVSSHTLSDIFSQMRQYFCDSMLVQFWHKYVIKYFCDSMSAHFGHIIYQNIASHISVFNIQLRGPGLHPPWKLFYQYFEGLKDCIQFFKTLEGPHVVLIVVIMN